MPAQGDILNGFVWSAGHNAWVVSLLSGQPLPDTGGGGGSSGDDFETTLVAAIGSTVEQTIPNWLAGAPIIDCPDDVLVAPVHRGAWLHMLSDIGSLIILPDDWLPGQAFGARQLGVGSVFWQTTGGSTMQLPFTRALHTGISEQYEEVIFKVVTNVGGHAAVWGVSGGTI